MTPPKHPLVLKKDGTPMKPPKLPTYNKKLTSEARSTKSEIDEMTTLELIDDLVNEMEMDIDLGLHWKDKYKFWLVWSRVRNLETVNKFNKELYHDSFRSK